MSKKIILFLFVFATPFFLNFILPISFKGISIIGGIDSEVIWLSFWGTYISSIISSIIAFYILNINRKDNFNILIYQHECDTLREKIRILVDYIDIYNINNVKLIYNRWKVGINKNQDLNIEIKELMDKAFRTFEIFSLNYYVEEFNQTPFLKKQEENYYSFVRFLQDFQIILQFDYKLWNNPTEFKNFLYLHQNSFLDIISHSFLENIKNTTQEEESIFKILCDAYDDITQVNIESQVRNYIESERLNLENKFKNITQ